MDKKTRKYIPGVVYPPSNGRHCCTRINRGIFCIKKSIKKKILRLFHAANFKKQHANHQSDRVRLLHSSTWKKFGSC